VYVTADKEEEEEEIVTSFFMEIITFRPLVCPKWLDRFLFLLA